MRLNCTESNHRLRIGLYRIVYRKPLDYSNVKSDHHLLTITCFRNFSKCLKCTNSSTSLNNPVLWLGNKATPCRVPFPGPQPMNAGAGVHLFPHSGVPEPLHLHSILWHKKKEEWTHPGQIGLEEKLVG